MLNHSLQHPLIAHRRHFQHRRPRPRPRPRPRGRGRGRGLFVVFLRELYPFRRGFHYDCEMPIVVVQSRQIILVYMYDEFQVSRRAILELQ